MAITKVDSSIRRYRARFCNSSDFANAKLATKVLEMDWFPPQAIPAAERRRPIRYNVLSY